MRDVSCIGKVGLVSQDRLDLLQCQGEVFVQRGLVYLRRKETSPDLRVPFSVRRRRNLKAHLRGRD